MPKPLPLEVLLSREITKNRARIMMEVDLGLVYVTQGREAAQKRALDVYIKRSKSKGTWGASRQVFRILGIDPFDADEIRSLVELGDHILEDHFRYPTTMWEYYCKGYISFNDLAECREKRHDKQGDRKHFYSEGLAYIEAHFIKEVKERGYKPATTARGNPPKKLHHVDEIQESGVPIDYVHDKKESEQIYLEVLDLTQQNLFPDEVEQPINDLDVNKSFRREGGSVQVWVNRYERDPQARKECIKHYGTNCFVCGFNFGKVFGQIGEGFIHVHHLKPVSASLGQEYEVNPIEDLRPVCPNCHAMIHRQKPILSIETIQSLLQKFDFYKTE